VPPLGQSTKLVAKRTMFAVFWRCPSIFVRILQKFIGVLDFPSWMRMHFSAAPRHFANRYQIFDFIGEQIVGKQVLYLEFGVYEGESIKYWSQILKDPESILHGFDSFEGLPEDWNHAHARGGFSTGGQIPEVADTRVTFFKGWFDQVLPEYRLPAHDILIINIDADLYSSTRLILHHLKDSIVIGTWLYFDEFTDRHHEFRAFREFVEETGMQFEAIAESGWDNAYLEQVAFRRIA
jgi:Macrocin-O-methyltransferase (TylF)